MADNPPIMQSPPGAEITVDGRRYLYFGGTSYLGLAGRAEVIEAACETTRRLGIHTATSRGGFGNNPATLAVESLAARFFGTETAFYYVSGFLGNHILIQASEQFDLVAIDEAAHFSSQEAAKLAGKPIVKFRHSDPESLRREFREHLKPGGAPLVMVDGVCPATGAVAPLEEIVDVLGEFDGAILIVDDAHGVGVLGEHGRGTLEHCGLWTSAINAIERDNRPVIRMSGTLSKALGGFGGILPCSAAFLERIRQTSHYWDGASAPAAPIAGASARALEIVMAEPDLRTSLHENAAAVRTGLRALGLAVDDWPTPIIGLVVGSAENMLRIERELQTAGILVPYMRSYSGVGAEGLLRIAVFATHTREMIERLTGELAKIV